MMYRNPEEARDSMDTSDTIRIEIFVHDADADRLERVLSKHRSGIRASVDRAHSRSFRFESADPTVLVAIVGASSAALGSLITRLFAFLGQKQRNKITIRDGDKMIEVPIGLLEKDKMERLEELLDKIRKMDRPQIHL
jgi:hypothetical protein